MTNDTVKGFRDYTGEEARKRQRIKGIIAGIFQKYGFEVAETPVLEYEEFVKSGNEPSEVISDIFKLQDKGKRNLALRYEFTFQLKRIAQNKKLPYKRYQIGEVFRDEPVSMNRVRQITQCDADIIGSTAKDEAEILALASEILKELGINAVIYINNRKLLNEILDSEGIKNKSEVMREIDKLDKLPEDEIKKNLKKYKADKLLSIFKKPEKFFAKYVSYKEIKELKKECQNYGIKASFSPSLARGLSYYNGSIWEIKTKEMKETIIGGGSYPINGIQSTGISFGIERLSQLAKINADEKRILIISIGEDEKSIKLAKEMRKNSIPCTIMYNKVSKALEFANSYQLHYVIFLGEEEAKKKKVKLRDMKTGTELLCSEKDVIEKLSGKK
jgi:histidyl-tRNA synthetase